MILGSVEWYRDDLDRDPATYDSPITMLVTTAPDGRQVVDVIEAGPRIRITVEIADVLDQGGSITRGPDGVGVLRIEAESRTLVYRIVGFDHLRRQYLAEWPD